MKKHVLVNILLAFVILGLAGAVAAIFVKTRKEPEAKTPEKVVPKVVAPKIRALRDYRVLLTGTGTARPKVQLEITPLVSGKVVAKAANYLSGKYVRAGDMLFKIERTDYAQALAAAEGRIALLDAQLARLSQEKANLEGLEKIEGERVAIATRTYEKAKQLRDRGAGAQHEVDSALEAVLARKQQRQGILNDQALIEPRRRQLGAERKLAQVDRDKAQTALDRTTVTSPVTGLVLSCSVEVGERVQAGEVCGEVFGTDVMEVPVSVPASDLQWLDGAALVALAGPDAAAVDPIPADIVYREPRGEQVVARWKGVVDRLEAGLEAQTRMATLVVRVRGGLPLTGSNPGRAAILDRNRFCDVTIYGKVVPEAFVLPRRAIQPDGTVYLVKDGKLTRQPVKVARWTDDQAMILPDGGIRERDRVVIRQIPKPAPGMKVEPLDADPAATRPAGMPGSTPTGDNEPAATR